jgi:hypothetical protein
MKSNANPRAAFATERSREGTRKGQNCVDFGEKLSFRQIFARESAFRAPKMAETARN